MGNTRITFPSDEDINSFNEWVIKNNFINKPNKKSGQK